MSSEMIQKPSELGAVQVPVCHRTESPDKNMKHGSVDTLVDEACKEITELQPSDNSNFLKRCSQNTYLSCNVIILLNFLVDF